MNVESKLWKVQVMNVAYAAIVQKATGVTRYIHPGLLPTTNALAMASETRFDAIMRDLFHSAARHN